MEQTITLLPEIHTIARDTDNVYEDEMKYSLAKAIRYIEKSELEASHIELQFITEPDKQEYMFTTLGLFSDVRIQLNQGSIPTYLDKTNYFKDVDKGQPTSYCQYGNKLILNPIPTQEYPIYLNVKRTFTNDQLDNYYFDSKYHDLLVYATLFYFYTDYLQEDDKAQKYGALMIAENQQLKEYTNRNEMKFSLDPWLTYVL